MIFKDTPEYQDSDTPNFREAVRTSHFRNPFKMSFPEPGVLKITHIPSGESVTLASEEVLGKEHPLTLQRVEAALHTLNLCVGIATFPVDAG